MPNRVLVTTLMALLAFCLTTDRTGALAEDQEATAAVVRGDRSSLPLPEADDEELKLLGKQITALERIGEFGETIRLYQKRRAVLLRTLPPDAWRVRTEDVQIRMASRAAALPPEQARKLGPTFADSIGDVKNLIAHERFEEAAKVALQSLEEFTRTFGGGHATTSYPLEELGKIRHAQERYGEAESYSRLALEIRSREFGYPHLYTATARKRLAEIYEATDRLQQAEAVARAALDEFRAISSEPSEQHVHALGQLAGILIKQRRGAEAMTLLDEALNISRETYGAEDSRTASTLAHVAAAKLLLGDAEDARNAARKSLDIHTGFYHAKHPLIAEAMTLLARVTAACGDLVEAEVYYRQALDMQRKALGENNPEISDQLTRLAAIVRTHGDVDGARDLLHEALAINRKHFGAAHSRVVENIVDLAGLTSDLDQRFQLLNDALTMHRESGSPDSRLVGRLLVAIGKMQIDRGEFDDAAANIRKALEIRERLIGATHPETTETILDLASVSFAQGHLDEALGRLQTSIALLEEHPGSHPERIAEGYHQLALVHARRGMHEAAIENLRKAFALLSPRPRGPITMHRAPERPATPTATGIVVDIVLSLLELGRVKEALELTELSRSHALLDAFPDAAIQSARETAWLPSEPLGFDAIQSSLRQHESILQYLWFDHAVVAFAIVPSENDPGPVIGTIICEGRDNVAHLTTRIRTWYETIASPRLGASRTLAAADAVALRGTLLPESLSSLVGTSERLVIIPDGPLSRIPFALLLPDERPAISYSSSATAYVKARERRLGQRARARRKPSPRTALIVGDPILKRRPGPLLTSTLRSHRARLAEIAARDLIRRHEAAFANPAGSRAEVDRIAGVLADAGASVVTLLGEDASVGQLEVEAIGKSLLHITAGSMVGCPDRSSIALTRPLVPTIDDTGFLPLDRILDRWHGQLDRCELVTLSVCAPTADFCDRNASASLPSGFLHAGAPTVITTLWEVDPRARELLLGRFYENLLGTHEDVRRHRSKEYAGGQPMSKQAALDEAQIWLRELTWADVARPAGPADPVATSALASAPDLTDQPFNSPSAWAGFVLFGCTD